VQTTRGLRSPSPLRELEVDHSFTDLSRDPGGRAWVRLECLDQRTVELWADEAYPVIQIYTADTLVPDRRRTAVAAEPMTCPPNALQTGEMLVCLEPGGEHVGSWGVRLR